MLILQFSMECTTFFIVACRPKKRFVQWLKHLYKIICLALINNKYKYYISH